MLLAIDLGNTNIVFGLFKGEKLLKEWRSPTDKIKLPHIKEKIEKVVIASVVPSLDKKLKKKILEKFGCVPHFVTAENIKGIKVLLKNKKEVGADRVVDALAAYKLYGGPAIVIDFGTATTFDVISGKGEYLGGAIAPGILLARDALHAKTAKLPKIEIKPPRRIIGASTMEAMQSGLVYGYAAMVEGMVKRIESEILNPKFETNPKSKNLSSKIKVIATGGLAGLICKYSSRDYLIDQQLTLKGLAIITQTNSIS